MSPSQYRGRLVTVNNVFITGGQCIASFIAGGLSYLPEHIAWRLMLGLAAIPAAIQFIGFLWVPESPRWLVSKGRFAEAKSVLEKIRGPAADITEEYESMVESNSSKDNEQGSLKILRDVLRDKYLRKALIVGCVLMSIQQLAGKNLTEF